MVNSMDWPLILSNIKDPKEIKETLLVLSDDLSDNESEILKELANRKEGCYPFFINHNSSGKKWLWSKRSNWKRLPIENYARRLPDNIYNLLQGEKKEGIPQVNYYANPQEAWIDLFDVIRKLANEKHAIPISESRSQ